MLTRIFLQPQLTRVPLYAAPAAPPEEPKPATKPDKSPSPASPPKPVPQPPPSPDPAEAPKPCGKPIPGRCPINVPPDPDSAP